MKKGYLTTFQVAKLMSVTPDSILKWIKSGKLEARRTLGGHYRISRKSVEGILKASEKPTAPQPIFHKQDFQYCWEFNAGEKNCIDDCEDCLVYKAQVLRCYEISKFPEEFGVLKLFCKSTCDKCEYYNLMKARN